MNATATDIGLWILCLIAILPLIRWLRESGRAQPRKISPNPLTVQAVKEYATREELNILRGEVKDRISSMEQLQKEHTTRIESLISKHSVEGENRIVRIHDRIDELSTSFNSFMLTISKSLAGIAARCEVFHGGKPQ